jgi:hypothetical protein
LHILKIENNQFCYPELVNHLRNHFISFSRSRKEIQDFEKDRRYGELYAKAASKFRDYNVNEGEAGELLLFCFLESHLKVSKILTKLEIKLSSKDYAKGSDGIHLLKVADKDYQLIFGESKLYQSLTSSITKAFESIQDFLTRKSNNVNDEIGLINSQLCREAFDEDLYQFLKSVIMPKANAEEPINKNNAFAIFAGFEINPTDEEKKLSNSDFLKTIKRVNSCKAAGLPTPVLEEDGGGFIVKLFKDRFLEEELQKAGLNERQIKAVLHVKEKGKITNSEYQAINSVSKRTATNDLAELVSQFSLLRKIRTSGSNIWYEGVGQ